MENFVFNRYSAITRRIHLPKHRTPMQFTPSISFMGGGQLWMFAIGVGHYVYENYDINKIKFLASSSGTFAAVPLACGLDPYDWCKRDWAKCIEHFETRGILGCLYDTKHFYHSLWNDYLPEDAHIRCSGRLFISVTMFPSMRNKVISQFHSREELIWAIVGSICLPFVFIRDFPVKCSDEIGYVMDGGFSNDSPCLDSYTITVSALHRKADIKPVMTDPNYYEHRHHQQHQQQQHQQHHQQHQHQHQHQRVNVAPIINSSNNSSNNNNGNSGESAGELAAVAVDSDSGPPPLGAWKSRNGCSVTPADFDNPMTGAEEEFPRMLAMMNEREQKDDESESSESCSSESDGNLLVEATVAEANTRKDNRDPASSEGASSSAMEAAYKESIRIRPIDIIQVPKYDRVWQIGSMGQDSASKCLDFERHEWVSIRKTQQA
eukprot:CAMPEP_0170414130 /NCGR_PEP_ID=MMETSP0117_2-20130122/31901_1 /TAXON_ID=400756 /ORGANISM="Durinskia baltica, Strain CSIRO CS-38" /LENGTH=434 /DNA_ID=CAMNT_0010671993 /DNA_START=304 /DNA_END=1608 /DNA_ORIENTATION=-